MLMTLGIIIVAFITWGVTTFGIQVFHYYERFVSHLNLWISSTHSRSYRFAFIPQLIVISILYGVSAKNFDLTTASIGDSRTVIGSRYCVSEPNCLEHLDNWYA